MGQVHISNSNCPTIYRGGKLQAFQSPLEPLSCPNSKQRDSEGEAVVWQKGSTPPPVTREIRYEWENFEGTEGNTCYAYMVGVIGEQWSRVLSIFCRKVTKYTQLQLRNQIKDHQDPIIKLTRDNLTTEIESNQKLCFIPYETAMPRLLESILGIFFFILLIENILKGLLELL
jgi:hypothetical protein